MDHYRMRLPPGIPTNCVCGYGNWGVRRTATGAPRLLPELRLRARSETEQGFHLDVGSDKSADKLAWMGRLLVEKEDSDDHRELAELEIARLQWISRSSCSSTQQSSGLVE